MLPKENRLKTKKEIERVFKKGKSFKEDFLLLKVTENNLKRSRFCLIVSGQISKKATMRNKIKRRISNLLGGKIGMLKKGIDGIIIALPGVLAKDFWEMEEVISKLFKKAKIIF